MPKKWICNEKCYVPVGGTLKLRLPGEKANGEIDKSAVKYFDLVADENKPEAQVDECVAVKARLKELNRKFHPATGLKKLKKVLAKAEEEAQE